MNVPEIGTPVSASCCWRRDLFAAGILKKYFRGKYRNGLKVTIDDYDDGHRSFPRAVKILNRAIELRTGSTSNSHA